MHHRACKAKFPSQAELRTHYNTQHALSATVVHDFVEGLDLEGMTRGGNQTDDNSDSDPVSDHPALNFCTSHTYIHTYTRTHIHKYIHTYIHSYMHACIHTHTYNHLYVGICAGGEQERFITHTAGWTKSHRVTVCEIDSLICLYIHAYACRLTHRERERYIHTSHIKHVYTHPFRHIHNQHSQPQSSMCRLE